MTISNEGRHNSSRRNKVILILAGLLMIAVLCTVIINTRGPSKVTGLKGDPSYARIRLTWDRNTKADGYNIYVSEDGKWKLAGQTERSDACDFPYSDYEKDREYKFRVAAYSNRLFSDKVREGKPSDPVSVIYETSQYASRIPVLTYHNITNGKTDPDDGLLISTEEFETQMRYLHDNGYKTLTMDEFRQWHAGELEVPVKSCVITFDDGYAGVYYFAYPIIKKYGLAATLFCVGKHIGEKTDEFDPDDPYACRVGMDAIEKVRNEYPDFEFESHTYDMHTRINGRKPLFVMSKEQISEDFKKNERFGFHYLAYPWGAYTDEMIEAAKENGIKMAFAYYPYKYASRDDDPYAINRVKISSGNSPEYFVRTVTLYYEDYK